MSIHTLIPYLPDYTQFDAEWAMSVCGTAGLYGTAGLLISPAAPISAAVFGVISTLSSRVFIWVFEKLECEQETVAQKVAVFITSLFAGSIVGAILTNIVGLSMSFAVGMILHAAVIGIVATIICVALPCLLCVGAAIGLHLLPDQ